nr:hypothetical protein pmam_74 [Pithovirus mammoth]
MSGINILIGVLVVINIVLFVIAIVYQIQLSRCEQTESIFCLQWVCPDDKPAVRIHKGQVVESGPFGIIVPRDGRPGREAPSSLCQ